jgi:hypothetical protein
MNEHLSDYIMITEPLMTKNVLDEILSDLNEVEWRIPDAMYGYDRTCTTFPVSSAVIGNYPIPAGKLDNVKKIDNTLLRVVHKALRIYQGRFPDIHTHSDSGFDILRYDIGQYVGSHIDDHAPRVLSMSIGLNDDYTGGEFRFWKNDNYIIKVPSGCAIMFPPNFMYPHEVLPVKSGVRYSMLTWFV